MKFKRIIALCVICIMALPFGVSAKTLEFSLGEALMYESDYNISSYPLENAPYVTNNRTMVPVRIISERFGAKVDWNGDTSEITIVKGDKTIVLTLGKAEAVVNGEAVALDVVPEVFNGRTMVPIRFISETLGMDVDYVSLTQQILISEDEAILEVGDEKITIEDYVSYLVYVGYDPEVDDMVALVDEATQIFKNVYAVSEHSKAEGYTPTGKYIQQAKENIEPYEDEIHKNALSAPIARLLEAEMTASELTGVYVESAEMIEEVISVYERDYITAKHILISTETRTDAEAKKIANDVLKQLKAGKDFDSLMNIYGEDPGVSSNPAGYNFTKGEMVEEFEKSAFALKEDAISGLVKSPFGYHIIKRCPLGELDSYTAYNITEKCALEFYDKIIEEALAETKITEHKTTKEIIAMFE